jgi:uncharacterized protein
MKRHFLIKLIPPRPSFALDMSEEERELMQQHIAYWTALAEKGVALCFGPVLDPAGSYGIGVVELADEAGLEVLTANDPAARSGGLFKHKAYVMPGLVVAKGPRESVAPGSNSAATRDKH